MEKNHLNIINKAQGNRLLKKQLAKKRGYASCLCIHEIN